MASTYSTNLKIELMATGENSGSWGTITNTNLGTALEQAVVGYGNPNYASDANLTLTLTDSNAAQAARALVLNVTSGVSLTATRELVVPTIQKQYVVQNNTTGSQSITVKTSAGTGITVPNGRKAHLYVDGTNVIQMFDFVDINGGTIDGVTIGGASAGAATFTTLSATGNVTLGDASADTVTVTGTTTFVTKPTVQLTSAATNTVTQAMRLDSQSSGTPAAGIGVGLEFAAETAAGNTEVGATLEAVTTDVTATSEDFDFVVKLMIAGAAAAETARFKGTGLSLVTGDTYQINNVDVLSATALGAGILGATQTWTAAQTFRAANAIRSEAAATQDAVVLAGRAGGTGSFAVTLTPTTLTANRTITLPDGAVTLTSGTTAVLGTAQTFTAAQTFRAANAVRSEAAATQDAIVLAGRAGGTSSYAATITTATLAASVTHTLPAITGTLATLANTSQTFAGATTFSNATTTFSATTPVVAVPTNGLTIQRTTASQSTVYPLSVTNSPTGTWTANAGVGIRFNASYNNSLTSTAYKIADLNFAYSDNASGSTMDLSLFSTAGIQQKMLTADATFSRISIGTLAAASGGNIYDITDTGTLAVGASAGSVDRQGSVGAAPTMSTAPTYGTFVGMQAGVIATSRSTAPAIQYGANNTAVGYLAGSISLDDISSAGALTVLAGAYNTYLGALAGALSQSAAGTVGRGDYNVGIGASACFAAGYNIGNYNVGVGYNSLFALFGSIGDYNVAVGYSSGSTNIGDRNTLIGPGAGNGLFALATGVTLIGGISGSAIPSNYDVAIGNGTPGTADLALYATGADGLGAGFTDIYFGTSGATAVNLRNATGLKVFDSEFRVVDNTDTTKVLQFECSGITTATTRTLTVPNASGTIALLSGTQTFSGTTTFSAAVTMSGTTVSYSIGTSQTTGTTTIGGTAQTGAITVGRSTGAQTVDIAVGATTSGTTKTVNIGTTGVSGSTTNVNMGSAVSGAVTNLNFSGNVQMRSGATVVWAPAPASISTTATLTNANIQAQIINTTGTSYTVTMPLGTTLETLVPWVAVDLGYDFTVINTASGTITMAVNTGVTSLGDLTIATGVSAQFRIRRTAANTFVMYRIS